MIKSKFGLQAEQALREAVKEAIEEHKRKGVPIVVRKDKKQ